MICIQDKHEINNKCNKNKVLFLFHKFIKIKLTKTAKKQKNQNKRVKKLNAQVLYIQTITVNS